jgi:hypothetical protein
MAKQKPQPSPDAMVKAEAQVKVAEIRASSEAKEGQADRDHEMMIEAIESELGMKDMLVKRGINVDNLKGALAQTAMKIRQDREAMARNPEPKQVVVT